MIERETEIGSETEIGTGIATDIGRETAIVAVTETDMPDATMIVRGSGITRVITMMTHAASADTNHLIILRLVKPRVCWSTLSSILLHSLAYLPKFPARVRTSLSGPVLDGYGLSAIESFRAPDNICPYVYS